MSDSTRPRIGVIGLGAMGARIATRLVWERFNPQVYDVVDVSVRMFTNDVGGTMSGSPKMMAQTCDVIMTVLPSTDVLRDVLYGWEGLAAGFAPGGVVVDMGGSDPLVTAELGQRLAEREIHLIDAPALGTTTEARAGKLTLVVGGSETAIMKCQPIFDVLASRTFHVGPVGSGQAAAAIGDFLRGLQILATSEVLRVAERFGLKPEPVIDVCQALSGLGPGMSSLLKEQVLTRRFNTGLALGHMLQSTSITASLARSPGIHAPLLVAAHDAWAAAKAEIGSGADQSEIIRWLEAVVLERPD
jgi:3-hydroxyisobutyrate dehydrogenase